MDVCQLPLTAVVADEPHWLKKRLHAHIQLDLAFILHPPALASITGMQVIKDDADTIVKRLMRSKSSSRLR